MDYCEFGSVESLLDSAGEGMPEAAIRFVSRDVLLALAFLLEHSCPLKEVRCANILIDSKFNCKLGDYGAVEVAKEIMSKRSSAVGLPYWLAPELLEGIADFSTAVIWSFGITCIEMAEILPPNYQMHPMRALFMLAKNAAPKLADETKWSPEFVQFVDSCLQKDVASRADVKFLLKHQFVGNISGRKEEVISSFINSAKQSSRTF